MNTTIKTPNTKHQTPTRTLAIAALVFGVWVLVFSPAAHADLTATVTPGHTFREGERPTTSLLNRLGTPSIVITGTIGGTNAGIAAGSINGSHLAPGVVDGVTISFTNSSPQALRVRTPGLAGPGLTGATEGGELTNNVDGVRITITNDVVTLATNIPLIYLECPSNYTTIGTGSGYLTNISLNSMAALLTNTPALITIAGNNTNAMYQVTNYFVSGTIGRTGWGYGEVTNATHGLGVVPKFVRVVFVCIDPDLGYAADDEVDVDGVFVYTPPGGLNWRRVFNYGANSTGVFITRGDGDSSTTISLYHRSTGVLSAIDLDDWLLKIYAKP